MTRRSTNSYWLLFQLLLWGWLFVDGKKVRHVSLPYRDVEICNETPFVAQLEMKVNYENQELSLHVQELPARSCATVEVLPGVHYSAWTERRGSKQQLHPSSHVIEEAVDKYSFTSELIPRKSPTTSFLATQSTTANGQNFVQPLTVAERVSDKLRLKVWNLLQQEILVLVEDKSLGQHRIVGQVSPFSEEYVMVRKGDIVCITMTSTPTVIYDQIPADPQQPLIVLRDEGAIPPDLERRLQKRLSFQEKYYRNTGRRWISYFGDKPRPRPQFPYWPADYVGQRHVVQTKADYLTDCNDGEKRKKKTKKCSSAHNDHVTSLELEVISTKPKIFLIRNFLHAEEAQRIIELATPHLQSSAVGSTKTDSKQEKKEDIRKSSTAWLPYFTDPQIKRVYERSADVLNIPIKSLRSRRQSEDLQVVRYFAGEKYDGHYDWGDYGAENTRCITLLMYLTNQSDPEAGGETAFLKAPFYNNQTKKHEVGFKIHPGAGSAVLFYNVLPDGNGDELTFHASLPVKRGTKWLTNLWVWDPYFQKDYEDAFREEL